MTVLTYTGDAEGHNGQSATLGAGLADDEGNPIAGMQLSFVLGSQGGSVLSGDDGAGATNVTLNQCPGAYTDRELPFPAMTTMSLRPIPILSNS